MAVRAFGSGYEGTASEEIANLSVSDQHAKVHSSSPDAVKAIEPKFLENVQ